VLSRGLAALTLVGLGLVLGTVMQPQSASAQGQVGIVGGAGSGAAASETQGMISAADQRKAMIDELRTLNSRMDRIEGLLSKGLTVKVSEMPAIRERSDDDRADKNSDKK
jgi:hypothetical protein